MISIYIYYDNDGDVDDDDDDGRDDDGENFEHEIAERHRWEEVNKLYSTGIFHF